MHPELSNLQTNYNRIIDDFDAGHITFEQATSTIAAMTAVDGGGWVWSIDPQSGSFVRAQPGGPAQAAEPSLFVPSQVNVDPQLVAPPSSGPSAPPVSIPGVRGGFDELLRPPMAGREAGLGDPANGIGPGADQFAGGHFAGGQFSGVQFPGAGGPGGFSPMGPAQPLPSDDAYEAEEEGWLARVLEMLPSRGERAPRSAGEANGRTRTFILAGIGAVVLVGLILSSSGKPSPQHSTSGLPSSSSTTFAPPPTVATTLPSASTDGGLPSVAQMGRVFAGLRSGSAAAVAGDVIGISTKQAIVGAALYTGLSRMGYVVSTGPVSALNGGATATIYIGRPGQSAQITGTVYWTKRGGIWELYGLPNLH